MLRPNTTSADMRPAIIPALATGQRGQDMTKMKWADYDGEGIYVVRLKTHAHVWIPLHEQARELLNSMPTHNAETILTKADGKMPRAGDHVDHRAYQPQ